MELSALNASIAPLDAGAMRLSKARWDSIAKPLGSLGALEDAVIRIAGLTGSADVSLRKRGVVVMCADNGVVEEGVTQTGQEITALVAGNMAKGDASVCRMSDIARADVFPVDIGMACKAADVMDRSVARGTKNMTKGPAMSLFEAEKAVQAGIEVVRELKDKGYGILATGEMGIGNTTTSSALCSVFLSKPAAEVTGRGAGLSDDGLGRKISAIERAIELNRPSAEAPLDALAKVGGFDIAGLAGVFIGGAIYRVPVIIDGFISAAAALTASRLCPASAVSMLASHMSDEPASAMVMEALGLAPMLRAGMRLGEGTGAVCLLPLLDMALSVYGGMSTFSGIGMEAYTPQGGK